MFLLIADSLMKQNVTYDYNNTFCFKIKNFVRVAT